MATITSTSSRDSNALYRAITRKPEQGPSEQELSGKRFTNSPMDGLDYNDPTSVTFPFLRRMRRDHMIALGLHFITMPLLRATWYIESDNAKAAALADNILRPVFAQIVEASMRMLWAGYSPMAKNFTTVKPEWTYIEAGKAKKVWDNGPIEALIYSGVTPLKPETAMPMWKKGKFDGITYDKSFGSGYFVIEGTRKPEIDLNHAVWAVNDQMNEDGSPWGFPRIAHAAPIFYLYRYIWRLLGRAFENSADPGPVVYFPSTELGKVVDGVQQFTVQQRALQIGTSKRSGSTVALPSDVYSDYQDRPTSIRKWAIEYPEVKTDFESMQSFLGALEASKLRALFLQEQGIIEADGGQSTNNISEFGSQREASQSVLMGQVLQLAMESFVRPAMAINMPEFAGRMEIKVLGFGQNDEDLLRQLIQLTLAKDNTNFGINMQKIIEARGVPMHNPDEIERIREEAIKQQQAMTAPVVEPNQGRRAKVTQTGFDRSSGQATTSYVQLGYDLGSIDGDETFISGLPRTQAFSDPMVVQTTREMRWEAKSFLSWLYNGYARYLSRVDLGEYDNDELDESNGSRPESIAAAVLSDWKPSAERVDGYAEKVRDLANRVYSRASSQTIRSLDQDINLNPFDRDHSTAWLSQHSADRVEQILSRVGTDLIDVVADGIRNGLTNKEIASDVREHFASVPAQAAEALALEDATEIFNHGVLVAGLAAGVKMSQTLVTGNIVSVASQVTGRVQGDLRLLPGATDKLGVVTADLEGNRLAMYDETTEQIMFSTRASEQDRAQYMLAIGESLARLPDVG